MTEKKTSLENDLLLSFLCGTLGFVFGKVGSWINPLGIPRAIQEIQEGGIKNLTNFTYASMGAIGYYVGYSNIIKEIVENPLDVKSYIPVITNTVVLSFEARKYLQNRRNEKSLEEQSS